MNDHDAIDHISFALDEFFRGNLSCIDVVTRVSYTIGANKISHQEAKEQQ